LLLAAFNTRMAAAAGRVADGVIGHGLFTRSWWDDVVRPAVRDGAAGRADPPVEHGWIITAIDDAAPERAVADARRMIGFYLTVRTYDPFVAHHGWEGPVERLRAAFRAGDTDGMAAAVTDEMVAAIALCGTTADAKELLLRRGASLPRDVGYFAPPSFLVGRRRRDAYVRASLALIGDVPAVC
jgi:5,10-methylenetetrahydromethanopterin reductase